MQNATDATTARKKKPALQPRVSSPPSLPQVAFGRKTTRSVTLKTDFSTAVQDAAWHYFIGQSAIYEEYGVKAKDVEKAAMRDLNEIRVIAKPVI
jgi:hypothetical protein